MSAFLAVRKAESVEILSDCGSWDTSGAARGMLSKSLGIGRTGAVVVGRGDIRITWWFVKNAAAIFDTFEDLVAGYTALMARGRREMGPAFEEHQHLIAGYHRARGRLEMYCASRDGVLHDTEPVVACGPERAIFHFVAPFIDPEGDWRTERIEALDLVAVGLPAFEAMRREPCRLFPDDPASPIVIGVGFGVEYTRIGARGVEARRIVHLWRDRSGERVAAAA